MYYRPEVVGTGCGTALYAPCSRSLESEDVQTIVAGVSLPNPGSVSLHERFGFRPVGVFHAVGRKFDKYWDVAWFRASCGSLIRATPTRQLGGIRSSPCTLPQAIF